ncbi:MAG: hypothetical protein WBB39_02570 [Candidatus Saccharimonadales bacterium]
MKRLSQTLKVMLALIVGVFSNNLWPAVASAYSTTNPVPSGGTVYVCKYKGTPGVDEVYKPGQNPIAVSLTANETRQVGTYFEDSQGRSYVVGWDNGDGIAPTLQDCPAPQGGNTVTATAPTVIPVCGANNDTITFATTANVTYSQTGWAGGSNTVSSIAAAGYTLTGTSSWTYSDNTVAGCMTAMPTDPLFTDDCGTAGDTYTIKASEGATYYVNGIAVTTYGTFPASGTVTVTAVANSGYIMSTSYPTNGWTHVYEGNCVAEVPAEPAPYDPCGLDNASWVLPDDTTEVSWSIVKDHLIATANTGYEFGPGVTTHDFGLAKDSGERCVIPVPTEPSQNDPCGLNNATWSVPSNTSQITWTLVNGELIATTTANYEFEGGATTKNFGTPTESEILCAVVVEPSSTDFCGNEYDEITYEGAVGVDYNIEWNEDHTVATVTATAQEGYAIEPETQTSWTLNFPNDEVCKKVTICHATDSRTNQYVKLTVNTNAADGIAGNSLRVPDHYMHDGPIYYDGIDQDWGDVIPAIDGAHDGLNLTVLGQYMLDHDCMIPAESTASYTVTPCVATTTPTIDTFSLTLTNTADDSEGDVTYTITLGSIVKTVTIEDGESMTINYPRLAAGTYSLAIAASDGTVFAAESVKVGSCGAILGEETTKPVTRVLAAQTLPAELPATGGESNGYLLLGIVVSAMTYFVVLRRQHA